MSSDPLFEIRGLQKWYRSNDGGLFDFLRDEQFLKAVDDISFDIEQGEILGVAGQSGCGKSTLGELLVLLREATGGEIRFRDENIVDYDAAERKAFRRDCQIIFQNPYESLNPRFTVSQTVVEPLTIHDIGDSEERSARAMRALEDAGLTPADQYLDKFPTELSGGERQRVSIARALVTDPEFIVADEPVSMLDVSIRTEILHLFEKLQAERDFTMLYISHDLSTINYLADRTLIMYLGAIAELGDTQSVIQNPSHPYTEALLNSVPVPDPDAGRVGAENTGSDISGDVPDPVDLPTGCRFHPRCKYATEECREREPELAAVDPGREAACFHPVVERVDEAAQE
ncbi:ABC transporter ATP-binding protein [Halorussus litoreus]|uniref:ABC transporter ATP-binding protein n=1 Tax=Halorussus litoreus TaxID=1710536 RepID=UPI000E232B9E|nr:oligopeptide/dipeptide ABC transporter ATP-binding protein [Halorussus litoreus]